MRKNHLSGNIKRILAIACAAMVAVTSIPANSVAYASETGSTQEEQIAEPQAEETREEETQEEKTQEEETQEEEAQEEETQEEEPQEEEKQEEETQEEETQEEEKQEEETQEEEKQEEETQEEEIQEEEPQEVKAQEVEKQEDKKEKKKEVKKQEEKQEKKKEQKEEEIQEDLKEEQSKEKKNEGETEPETEPETTEPPKISAVINGKEISSNTYITNATEVVITFNSSIGPDAEGWKGKYTKDGAELDFSGSGTEFTLTLNEEGTYGGFSVTGMGENNVEAECAESITNLNIVIDRTEPYINANIVNSDAFKTEGGTYFFNEKTSKDGVSITFVISEEISESARNDWSVKYKYNGTGEESIPVEADNWNNNSKFTINLTKAGKYTDFSFSGSDRAGNGVDNAQCIKGLAIDIEAAPVVSVKKIVSEVTKTIGDVKYFDEKTPEIDESGVCIEFAVDKDIAEGKRADLSVSYGVAEDNKGTELTDIEWAAAGDAFTLKIHEEGEFKDFAVSYTDEYDNDVVNDASISALDLVIDKTAPYVTGAEFGTEPVITDGSKVYYNKKQVEEKTDDKPDQGIKVSFALSEAISESDRDWTVKCKMNAEDTTIPIDSWAEDGKSFVITLSNEGEYKSFTFSGTDTIGHDVNNEKNSESVSKLDIVIDKSAPEVKDFNLSTETTSHDIYFDNAPIKAAFKVEDPSNLSGVKSVRYFFNTEKEEPAKDAEGWETLTPDQSGEYLISLDPQKKGYIYISTEDNVGNDFVDVFRCIVVEDKEPQVTLNVDNTDSRKAHVISIDVDDLVPPVTISSGIRTVSYQVGSQTAVKLVDEGDPGTTNFKTDLTIDDESLEGVQTITVTASDWAGKTTVSEINAVFDHTAPEITIITNEGDFPKAYNDVVVKNKDKTGIEIEVKDKQGKDEQKDHTIFGKISVKKDETDLPEVTLEGCKSIKKAYEDGCIEYTYEFNLDDLGITDEGNYTLVVNASDGYLEGEAYVSENAAESKSIEFTVDQTAPEVKRKLEQEAKTINGVSTFNYDAMEDIKNENGGKGVEVSFTVKEVYFQTENWTYTYTVNGEGKTGTVGDGEVKWTSIDENGGTFSLFFKDDGLYKDFELTGKDAAGNTSVYADGDKSPAFLISAVNPQIRLAMNVSNKNSVYHNDGGFTVTISDTAAGSYISNAVITVKKGSASWPVDVIKKDGTEAKTEYITEILPADLVNQFGTEVESELVVTVEAETVTGNRSVIFTKDDNEKTIELSQVSTGNADWTEGHYFYDTVAPVITVTYDSKETAYVYSDKQEGVSANYSAYYKGDVKARFVMDDAFAEDKGRGLSSNIYIDNGKVESGTSAEKDYTAGVNTFTVWGTDLAGNPATVKEIWSGDVTDRTNRDAVTKVGDGLKGYGTKDNQYSSRVATVIDKDKPVVSFSGTPKKDEDSLEDGFRRYYKNTFYGEFTVTDKNYPMDVKLITAGVLKNEEQTYNKITADSSIGKDSVIDESNRKGTKFTITASKDQKTEENVLRFKRSVSANENHSADGVYRFKIFGTDKAGNEITMGSAAGEWSLFNGGDFFISQPKVLDTVAPTASLFVRTGTKDIYEVLVEKTGSTVYTYSPFQKVVDSYVSFATDDKSPVMLNLSVKSTDPDKAEDSRTTSLKSVFGNKVNKFRITTKNKDGKNVVRDVGNYKIGAKKQIITLNGIRVKDRAGNIVTLYKSNQLIFDGDAPKSDIIAPVTTFKARSAVTHRNADGRDLFRDKVDVDITITDPGMKVYSSGLKKVSYTVYVDGKAVDSAEDAWDGNYVTPSGAITNEVKNDEVSSKAHNNRLTYEKKYTVHLKKEYQTNDIAIKVTAIDNSGNKMKDAYYYCGIDSIGPEITVRYDNNSAQNGKYFKADRTAIIEIIDRNVDDGNIKVVTQGSVQGSLDWSSGGGNGANDSWTKRVYYTKDGDYTLSLEGSTDYLGNPASIHYTGTAPQEFTIDKTAPIINVTFDNNSVQNGKYYKDPRNASVEITEHNFRASDASIQTQVSPGGFSNNGDRHVANVYYGTDGVYTMTVNYTDLAGNPAKAVTVDEFVIDRTVPIIYVTFDNESAQNGKYYKDPRTATIRIQEHNFRESEVSITPDSVGQRRSGFGGGGDDHSATIDFSQDGEYAFVVKYTDLAGNPAKEFPIEEFVIDRTKPVVKFVVPSKNDSIFQGDIAPEIEYSDANINRGHATINLKGMKKSNALEVAEDSFDGTKGVVRFENLKKVRENDDIYTATAVVTDFAGNEEAVTITFSVNRFGSTYDYNSDEATGKLVEDYFTNAAGDVILREVNVNQLTEKKVTLYQDGENRVLKEGEDYTVEERIVNGHYEYIYTIKKENFVDEHNYNIVVTSKDKAGNTNSNSSVKGEEGGNEVPLRFAVDQTEPKFEVAGADISKKKFRESQITLDIRPVDNMNAVAKVRIRVLDKNGNVIGNNNFELEGKELADFLEEHDGKYTLTVDQNTGMQTIEMVVTDAAGNEHKETYDVLVTPNLFYQYINTPPAVAGTVAGVGGLLFFLIWKRKKDQEKENAA